MQGFKLIVLEQEPVNLPTKLCSPLKYISESQASPILLPEKEIKCIHMKGIAVNTQKREEW